MKPSRLSRIVRTMLSRQTIGAGVSLAAWGLPLPGFSAGEPGGAPQAGAEHLQMPALPLAGDYDPDMVLGDFWVSEKLDGIRAYWDGSRLLTRRGNPIAAPDWFTAGLPDRPLDGELWTGRGEFELVMSTVMDKAPDDSAWRRVHYKVFDLPDEPGNFSQRHRALQVVVNRYSVAHFGIVEQRRLSVQQGLADMLTAVTEQGGEGLMLRRELGPYRAGRQSGLFKLKSHQDADARVLAHIPGKGRLLGMMGALLVETAGGARFRIGTGFSDAQRRDPPPIGSLISYRYRGLTRKGKPRFASFLRQREDW